MIPELLGLLKDLENVKLPLERRLAVALGIGQEVLLREIDPSDIPLFYRAMVDLWRDQRLGAQQRDDKSLIEDRKNLAIACYRLSLRLPDSNRFFKYYPEVKRAEGFGGRHQNKLMAGEIKPGYGKSIYEFHWEYPIEGMGVRKDLIWVITDGNNRIPMLDWCKQNDVVVFCNRCGLDITYEVSKDCPYRK